MGPRDLPDALTMPAFLLPLLLAVLPVLQDSGPFCKLCQRTRRVTCPKHPAAECVLEEEVLACSVHADCEACGGAGYVPCERCDDPGARKDLEERRKRIATALAGLRRQDEAMGRPLAKVETAHFVLVWEVEGYKVGKKTVSPHEALHLYARRLEQLYADYVSILGVEDREFREKTWVFVWEDPADQKRAAMEFCSQEESNGGVKLMGLHSRYTVRGSRKAFRTDEQLHRNVLHMVTHLLLAHQEPTAWIGNSNGGWLDAGLAHWFEEQVAGICDNYCMQEGLRNPDFERGRYRLGVRKLVAKEDVPPMADLVTRNLDVLTPEMNAVAFSYVDYLLTLGGEKLNALAKALKRRTPTNEAIREIYGTNVLEVEQRWKAWVLETYPTK